MTPRQLCDLAEVALLARVEANEQFQLLRVIAEGLGARMAGWEAPAERLADVLDGLGSEPGEDADTRRAQVLAAVLAGDGEVA